MSTLADTTLPTFAERTTESTCGSARVLVLPTPAEGVVTFRGAFATRPNFGAGEERVQKLAVALLDKGTRRQDRFAVAEALDDRGAQLTFSADGLRCGFFGRVLRDDVEDVLALLAEQLREPLFDADEFEKVRARQAAALRRSLESTASQAAGAVARRIYSPDHPNYRPTVESELERLATLTVDDVRAYHESHFGARDFYLAVVGDVAPEPIERAVGATLGDWAEPSEEADFAESASPEAAGRVDVPVPDRQNLDVRMGGPLALRRTDDDYLALYAGNYVLGGNFSARLMSTVRDEQGLTYGIGSSLSGISPDYDGFWRIAVTLSGENLERGIEATLDETRRFVSDGISADELAEKQTTIAGAYTVGLATTGGLAAALLVNAERGFGPGYLDSYPDLIHALTVEDVNAAIRRHLDVDALHVGVAGSFPEVPPAASEAPSETSPEGSPA